jgi:putative effector of murein hydrolase
MTNLRIINVLLGLSIVCMAVALYIGFLQPFLVSIICTFLAGANRHHELAKLTKA